MNKKDFDNISMNGRLAYQLLCLEAYLTTKYPQKDFKALMSLLWQATDNMYWNEFADYIMDLAPINLYEFETYEKQEWLIITKDQYEELLPCIIKNDTNIDELFETIKDHTYVYEGTTIKLPGKESIDIVFETIKILKDSKIALPSIDKVQFSSINELNGWGNPFDGTKLSSIIKS